MATNERIIKVIKALVSNIELKTCKHESVQEGDGNWTICNHCGEDQDGGFKPLVRSAELEEADLLLKELEGQADASEPVSEGNSLEGGGWANNK